MALSLRVSAKRKREQKMISLNGQSLLSHESFEKDDDRGRQHWERRDSIKRSFYQHRITGGVGILFLSSFLWWKSCRPNRATIVRQEVHKETLYRRVLRPLHDTNWYLILWLLASWLPQASKTLWRYYWGALPGKNNVSNCWQFLRRGLGNFVLLDCHRVSKLAHKISRTRTFAGIKCWWQASLCLCCSRDRSRNPIRRCNWSPYIFSPPSPRSPSFYWAPHSPPITGKGRSRGGREESSSTEKRDAFFGSYLIASSPSFIYRKRIFPFGGKGKRGGISLLLVILLLDSLSFTVSNWLSVFLFSLPHSSARLNGKPRARA